MRRIAILSLLAVALAGHGAPAPLAKHESRLGRSDLARLQGEWEVIEIADRKKRTKLSEEGGSFTFVIASNRVTIRLRSKDINREEYEADLTLDPKSTPKKVSWQFISVRTGDKIKLFEREIVVPGIYRLARDELMICVDDDKEGTGPTSFEISENSTNVLIVC